MEYHRVRVLIIHYFELNLHHNIHFVIHNNATPKHKVSKHSITVLIDGITTGTA
jgi:archaellum component FlaG (FlaF/FlaG flagellin family)